MITYRIAMSGKDFKIATDLVEKAYEREGYIVANDTDINFSQISSFINRPGSVTLLAEDNSGSLRGTISVTKDSDRGLPMDSTYKTELDTLRDETKIFAEVCQFATDHKLVDGAIKKANHAFTATQTSFGLFAHAVHVALRGDITHLCFSVHTKHEAFYKLLGATPIGESKPYTLANNVPSRAFCIDLLQLQNNGASMSFTKKILDFIPQRDFYITNLFTQNHYEIPAA